ncbi:MAG: hypothetical protein GY778_16070 [bacterium]|nr:hypothetical protein [bacterium]
MTRGTQIGFRIASLGVAGTDRLVGFWSGPAPSWDTDGAWCHAVPYTRFFGQLASEVSFRDGTSTTGGMSFEVLPSSAIADGTTAEQMLYTLARVKVAEVEQTILYTDTDGLDTSDQTLAGVEVYVHQTGEVIRLGTHTGVGVYNGCTRGVWGTRPRNIKAGYGDFGTPDLYDPTRGPNLAFRRIEMLRVNMSTATSYSDIEVTWAGVIRSSGISRPKPGLIVIDADSVLGKIKGQKVRVAPWTGDVYTLIDPDADVSVTFGADPAARARGRWDVIGTSPDRAPGKTPSLLSLDGKGVVEVALAQTGGDVRYRGDYTTDALYLTGNNPRPPRLPTKPARAWEVDHHTGTTVGTRPYHQNLIDSLIECLVSTREGNNGDHDMGTDTDGDADYGLAVDADLVDVTAMERVRDRLGSMLVQPLNFFNADKPDGVNVLEWYGERLWPYGVVITQRGAKLSLALLEDHPDLTTATLTEAAHILGPSSEPPRPEPGHVRREDLAFVKARVEYSAYPGAEPISDTFVDVNNAATGDGANQDAPLAVLHGLDTTLAVDSVMSVLIQRFHEPLGQATFHTLRTAGATVDAGDLVSVTHATIPSSVNATRGVSDVAFLVTSKEDDLSTNTSVIVALDVGSLYANAARIAPALKVASYTSGATVTFEEDKAAGGYQSGLLDDAPEDLSDITAGWIMDHCDKRGVVRESGLEVLSVATPAVTFTSTPATPPIAGDVFRVADYDSCTAAQKARYAHFADSDGKLGAFDADGDQYTAY